MVEMEAIGGASLFHVPPEGVAVSNSVFPSHILSGPVIETTGSATTVIGRESIVVPHTLVKL
jgi:hypothetical protein